jgi:hypothetical protein
MITKYMVVYNSENLRFIGDVAGGLKISEDREPMGIPMFFSSVEEASEWLNCALARSETKDLDIYKTCKIVQVTVSFTVKEF